MKTFTVMVRMKDQQGSLLPVRVQCYDHSTAMKLAESQSGGTALGVILVE
jgi:hypothetical protein